ncbi:hypothetical protein AMATHDRAFT_41599 [Amanita thiersii Skay4041]|uniref:DUF6533 domain-containing protein n=1 Tax=Amanita thiersii Skay4041 TaxID=703135 RepID=A0A2A9NM29_9AGAR|nr:hypothetical protein AMATHDRAFT_41599 [Amanita thiersii Skay4041]
MDSAGLALIARQVILQRCVSAASFALSLYDVLLSINDEIQLIWKNNAERRSMKFVYVSCRYVPCIMLAYFLSVAINNNNKASCVAYMVIEGVCGASMIVTWQLICGVRIWEAWNYQKSALHSLTIGFVACISTTMTMLVFIVRWSIENLVVVPLAASGTCIVRKKNQYLAALYIIMLVFDVYLLTMIIMNSVAKPYRKNNDVVVNLHRDGARFLALLIALKLTAAVLSYSSDFLYEYILSPLTISVSSVTLSRLQLKVRTISRTESQMVPLLTIERSTSS